MIDKLRLGNVCMTTKTKKNYLLLISENDKDCMQKKECMIQKVTQTNHLYNNHNHRHQNYRQLQKKDNTKKRKTVQKQTKKKKTKKMDKTAIPTSKLHNTDGNTVVMHGNYTPQRPYSYKVQYKDNSQPMYTPFVLKDQF